VPKPACLANSAGGGIYSGGALTVRAGDATGARCPWPKGIGSNPRERAHEDGFQGYGALGQAIREGLDPEGRHE
jgi:hypothetical protein